MEVQKTQTEKEKYLAKCPESVLNEFEHLKKIGLYPKIIYFIDADIDLKDSYYVSLINPSIAFNNYIILKD